MAAVGVTAVVVLALGVLAPLVLYWLVRAERARDAERVTDFEAAERTARRDEK
ncbi:hypothetical protein RYH80_13320 [Halobaculum sp. MBLA0147]|uniref:hypothetical protein n=1 Tax=Halobaculum sp. MBLA0147 TaxID=3079934 RepID=UPI003523C5BA